MAANPAQLADYRSGKDKLFGFFVGQVMKATGGKANPAQVNESAEAHARWAMTPTGDLLHRFLFENLPVRGHLVRLDASWRAAIEHHEYPGAVSDGARRGDGCLVLMAGALKFEGRLSLQFEGPGPVRLMLAQCTHRHAIRGVARHDEIPPGQHRAESAVWLRAARGHDRAGARAATATRASCRSRQPRLSDCLEQYFERSEQLPSRIMLAATPDRAAGLLLQRVARRRRRHRQPHMAEADDAWRRIGLLAATVSTRELLDMPCRELLRKPLPRGRHPPVRGNAGFLPVQLLARTRRGDPAGARRRGSADTAARARRRGSAL